MPIDVAQEFYRLRESIHLITQLQGEGVTPPEEMLTLLQQARKDADRLSDLLHPFLNVRH